MDFYGEASTTDFESPICRFCKNRYKNDEKCSECIHDERNRDIKHEAERYNLKDNRT